MDIKTRMLYKKYSYLFYIHNEKTRKIKKRKEKGENATEERKQKSARKCAFSSLPCRTIIYHYLDPVLSPSYYTHTHIYIEKYATQTQQLQFSGKKQHSDIAHASWSRKRWVGTRRKRKRKSCERKKLFWKLLWQRMSNFGIRRFQDMFFNFWIHQCLRFRFLSTEIVSLTCLFLSPIVSFLKCIPKFFNSSRYKFLSFHAFKKL